MKKRIVMCLSVAMSVVALAIPALASGGSTDIDTVMSGAFQEVVDKILASIGVILPIALGVLATTMAIKFGINFFRKIAGKAS